MRILTKRPAAILRPFLESTHFCFACLNIIFSRSLTKRPTAILRPFLESQSFGYVKIVLTILESPFGVENVCFFSAKRLKKK